MKQCKRASHKFIPVMVMQGLDIKTLPTCTCGWIWSNGIPLWYINSSSDVYNMYHIDKVGMQYYHAGLDDNPTAANYFKEQATLLTET